MGRVALLVVLVATVLPAPSATAADCRGAKEPRVRMADGKVRAVASFTVYAVDGKEVATWTAEQFCTQAGWLPKTEQQCGGKVPGLGGVSFRCRYRLLPTDVVTFDQSTGAPAQQPFDPDQYLREVEARQAAQGQPKPLDPKEFEGLPTVAEKTQQERETAGRLGLLIGALIGSFVLTWLAQRFVGGRTLLRVFLTGVGCAFVECIMATMVMFVQRNSDDMLTMVFLWLLGTVLWTFGWMVYLVVKRQPPPAQEKPGAAP